MLIDLPGVSEAHLSQIVALHADAMPDSLLTLVGTGFLRSYYRSVAASPVDFLLTERRDDEILGFVVVTADASGFLRRLVFSTSLVWRLFPAITRLPLRAMAALLLAPAEHMDEDLPELLIIATRAGHRGNGIGGSLVRRAEQLLRDRGAKGYYVRTSDKDDNEALGFYHRRGFVDGERFSHYGAPFRRLYKRGI